MITNADLFYYLETEAKKVAWKEAKLLKSTMEIFNPVKKIKHAFANKDEITPKLIRIQIIIDTYKVIWTFDYLLK